MTIGHDPASLANFRRIQGEIVDAWIAADRERYRTDPVYRAQQVQMAERYHNAFMRQMTAADLGLEP